MRAMTNQTPDPQDLQRNPDTWATADEPMTANQASYVRTLAEESGEDVPDEMTKADASKKIDELQQKSPRLNG